MQKRSSIGNRRKHYQRKRQIIVYSLRIGILLAFVLLMVLMVCGCLYLHDFFQAKKTSSTGTKEVKKYNVLQEGKSSFESAVRSIHNKVVVLDAGHGGKDAGTLSGQVYEKDITISVVKKMEKLLSEQGIEVLLTREDDSFLELEERVQIANEAQASLFMSIHCNYYEEDASVCGLECYYHKDSRTGKEFAEGIIADLEKVEEIIVRSAKAEDFYVLRHTDMPAVLVELGFLSNKKECKSLTLSQYQDKLANNLVESIIQKL